MLDIVVAGHSHTVAIAGRYTAETPTLVPIAQSLFAFLGPWPRAGDYWQGLNAVVAGRSLAMSWAGAEYKFFLFDDGQPIDETAVRKTFAAVLQPLYGLLLGYWNNDAGAICMIGHPPPKPAGALLELESMLNREPELLAEWQKLGAAKMRNEGQRLLLWEIQQDLLANVAQYCRCNFLRPPSASVDADGFLKPDYWYNDLTHANAAYGRLVIDQLRGLNG
jgi:hypothetical protein